MTWNAPPAWRGSAAIYWLNKLTVILTDGYRGLTIASPEAGRSA
jgi:hypothetical protein